MQEAATMQRGSCIKMPSSEKEVLLKEEEEGKFQSDKKEV
jgi:hypothetical protein